jgi:TrmH family RNA methyltransferase
MITSTDNPKIKQARALLMRKGRAVQRHCLAEGVRLIEDAMRAGNLPALLFYVPDALGAERAAALVQSALSAGVPSYEVGPAVFATLSDTQTSQGVIAVLPIPELAVAAEPAFVLILDHVRDPGNMGTILRSAEAAGVPLVLASGGSVDPFSPKVLRAGMGSHFRLALRADQDWIAIAKQVRGCNVWVADISGDVPYDQVSWTERCALVIGGETTGISPQALELSNGRVFIPMAGRVDSLNAAMAATVLVFEAARQRRALGAAAR